MLASHCCEILPDGTAPCNELMLHHTRQCTGASCKMLQSAANTTQLRVSKSKTEVLSQRHVFTQMFTHTHACLHIVFTRQYLHAQVFLHRDAFTDRRSGTSTHRCLHTAMLLQRNAFTRFYTGLLVTQNSLYAEAFTVNTLPQRCF